MPLTPVRYHRWPLFFPLMTGIVFFLTWSCHPADNPEVMPSDVYHVVDAINTQLSFMLATSGGNPNSIVVRPLPAPRQPRHVVQKAREVMLKLQRLRTLNGLPETPLPLFSTTETTLGDSKKILDQILHDVLDLRHKFIESESIENIINIDNKVTNFVAFTKDKTPMDIYLNLQHTNDLLDALGLPKTMPNDVYRLAVMINHDLETILIARHRILPPTLGSPSRGKVPDDTYAQGYQVLDRLRAKLNNDKNLSIRGGIVLPNRPQPPLTPGDVLDLENNMLAELGAIKTKVGVTAPTTIPPLIHGKTPSDVFDLMTRAEALVDAL